MKRIWWSEFTDEERAELEAWLAEVNRISAERFPVYDTEPGTAEADQAARLDPEAPF